MLATHHLKLLDSTLQVKAIQKVIDFDVPEHFICSKNVDLRQTLWACPNSAADIRTWREESEKAKPLVKEGTYSFDEQFPTVFDGHMKGLLVPTVDDVEQYQDKADIPYISTTPVPSLGVVHEVYKRGFESGKSNKLVDHVLQSNAMALSNHGETLLMQAGHYRAFRAYIPQKKYLTGPDFDYISENIDGSFLLFTAKVEKLNANSGLIAEGLPSITAIGGFVHMLERETLQNISFAVGVKRVDIQEGKQRYVDQAVKNKAKLTKGLLSNVRATMAETTATVELVLLLKTNNLPNSKKVRHLQDILLNQDFRIGGGAIFDKHIVFKTLDEYQFIDVKWLYSPKHFQSQIDQYFADNPTITVYQKSKEKNADVVTFEREPDVLDCALHFHHKYEKGNTYSIVANGYIYLEEPKERYGIRTNGYDHAFSEASFCMVNISNETDFTNLFWERHNHKNGVYWY